jgi:hypothetical protein
MSRGLTDVRVCTYIPAMDKSRNDTQIAVRMPLGLLAMLDEMRRDERDLPARTEMMRRLIARAYDARIDAKGKSESLRRV